MIDIKRPLFIAKSKETNKLVEGFGWCLSDYTEEFMKEKGYSMQDIYLYTTSGVVLYYLETVKQIF